MRSVRVPRFLPSLLLLPLALLGAGAVTAQAKVEVAAAADATVVEAETGAEAEAEAIFSRLDRDQDGQLSLEEFEAGLERRQGVVYQRLPAQFRSIDKDESGYLEAGEYATLPILRKAGAAAPSLAEADSSGDQRIDFREYAALVVRLSPVEN